MFRFKRLSSIVAAGALALTSVGPAQSQFRNPTQPVEDQFTMLAKGIKAEYFSREVGQDWDQMAFWPHGSDNPTHLVGCIEEGLACLTGTCAANLAFGDKLTPGVQTIDLATREVRTIVRGMTICDGIRTTPWGTVIATEEDFSSDVGSVYEILDPLSDDEFTILDRGLGGSPATIVDQNNQDASDRVAKRTAMPVIRYEGLYVHETGVVIAGDEERPGSYDGDTDGGAIYKFIPETLQPQGNITDLNNSPLVAGSTYALQASCRDNSQQYGQGCEIGNGAWVALTPTLAETGAGTGMPRIGREAAFDAGATSYYRPEDLHRDPMYTGSNPNAVRFCFASTGNQSGDNYGEVLCAIDQDVTNATGTTGEVTINRFIEGNTELNQPDNLAFQPYTGILYVIEDNSQWRYLGLVCRMVQITDVKSDGCARLLQLTDTSAEPTGFLFTPDGTQAYFNIQHSNDDNMPLVDDFRTGRPRSFNWL